MKRVSLLLFSLALALALCSVSLADSSHARIVRLSFVQGEVRFAPDFHNDPLTDPKATWQVAPLNLPLRDGNALSTGKGRAEIEFENGAIGFLDSDTVVEFYDLSLNDGYRVTRLVVRQGSASFSVDEQHGDYFSVTGGDFTVEVDGKAGFRLDNFDNGSTVNVTRGHVNVLQSDKTTPLDKGQSFAVRASEPAAPIVSHVGPGDDFDSWVSANTQATQVAYQNGSTYSNSYSNYPAGFSDLYSYGSWFNVNGLNCWRPFGMGFGWSPFADGGWYMDSAFGWSFLGASPWGWLPYHYGGWMMSPVYGWVWTPGAPGTTLTYRPVTAVYLRSGSTTALVPSSITDAHGKTPANLANGVYTIENGVVSKNLTNAGDQKWSIEKRIPQSTFSTTLAASTAPRIVARNLTVSTSGVRQTTVVHGSSIAFDPATHRFVNTPVAQSTTGHVATRNAIGVAPGSRSATVMPSARTFTPQPSYGAASRGSNTSSHGPVFAPPALAAPSFATSGSSMGTARSGGSGGGKPH